MVKAIIFDLDNTLIDFMKMKTISCEQAIDAMIDAGLKVDRKKALDELYTIYFKEGLEDPTIFQKFLKKITGCVDYRILAHGIVAYRQARIGFLKPYPGVKRTLLLLKHKGLKLAIVSDAPRLKAWIRLVNMGIDDIFDVVITFDDTGRLKPSSLPFKAALSKLKIAPVDALMVGDRPDRDVKGAKKIGMKTCFAKYGYTGINKSENIKIDFVINNIDEILKIV